MTPNEQKVSTAKGMVPVTDALLDQMVQAIVAEVDPEQVILFGSRARGDAREDSDVDLWWWRLSRLGRLEADV